jgi:hypothetical protein
MTYDEALERASRLVPRTWDLLQECRTVRLTLEDETFPPPDAATEAEMAIYRGLAEGLERALLRGLQDALNVLRAMRGMAAIEAEGWLRRQLEGLTGREPGEGRE